MQSTNNIRATAVETLTRTFALQRLVTYSDKVTGGVNGAKVQFGSRALPYLLN